ncbi:ABC transporter ATP-binding protein [Pseudoduganella umbonata]|uniref:ABC transporter ATP-binding protein n=1 Tax=Pseudoduganella umbonata TaxID=864828 RepID=A0A4P8HZY4_9BURK|nr:ABC transporter ATP-binding protein [Pseudoduganella umbonata]MBB3224101.1 phospholipid/cholesterol/gamma-HCH transport system ATP-binding protein [Pseudoduganella umbonata]QCP14035.1 ABC transporter ATP-binding protein [Pseudoduganella umbonata]
MPTFSLASPGLAYPDILHPASRRRLTAQSARRDAFVELDGVGFAYQPGRPVLADLTLRFPRGKVTTILGGSGCGKTTLLRLIGGVHAPLSGRVLVDGETVDARDASRLQRLRRRMGVLFQFGALFTDLDVFENVAFPIREHTLLPAAVVRDLVLMKLNAVGLRGAAGLRIGEISGGMARRVALARAIALDPELIMYDEPFAGLDGVSMAVTARLIRTLNDATGATSLLVSHDVPESLGISDHVVLLGTQGRVLAQGTPDELLASADPETRQFLHGGADGPLRFHYPAPTLAADFGVPE